MSKKQRKDHWERYGEGWGTIEANTLYNSAEFRRRLSSGRGPMSADTLSDWINDGLKVQRGPDGRIWIKGRWFLDWLCKQDSIDSQQ